MSIQLQMKTDHILEEAGLSELSLNIRSKNLQIVGGCGQTIVTNYGVVFSKNTPSLKEIDYAIPKIKAFIEEHAKTLKEFIVLRKKRKELEKDRPVPGDDKLSAMYGNSLRYNVSSSVTLQITYNKPTSELMYSITGLQTISTIKEIAELIDAKKEQWLEYITKNMGYIKESSELDKKINEVRNNLAGNCY